jgi:hypothetical protein
MTFRGAPFASKGLSSDLLLSTIFYLSTITIVEKYSFFNCHYDPYHRRHYYHHLRVDHRD